MCRARMWRPSSAHPVAPELGEEGAAVDAQQARRALAVALAVLEGAVRRVRPVLMTATATIVGLLPIMFGGGAGSEVMRRIAAPMVGGMVSATVLTLIVIPALFLLWQRREAA